MRDKPTPAAVERAAVELARAMQAAGMTAGELTYCGATLPPLLRGWARSHATARRFGEQGVSR